MIAALAVAGEDRSAPHPGLLTPQEADWLAAHPVIRLAPTPDYQPIEFFNDAGHYSGITADCFKLIEQRLGCRFTVVRPTPEQWLQLDPNVRGADVITASAETPKRREYWSFTTSYLSLPTYVITRESTEDGLTLDRLDERGSPSLRVGGGGVFAHQSFELVIEAVSDAATGLQSLLWPRGCLHFRIAGRNDLDGEERDFQSEDLC